eukprot:5278477-Amphidinium_carterae.1
MESSRGNVYPGQRSPISDDRLTPIPQNSYIFDRNQPGRAMQTHKQQFIPKEVLQVSNVLHMEVSIDVPICFPLSQASLCNDHPLFWSHSHLFSSLEEVPNVCMLAAQKIKVDLRQVDVLTQTVAT